MAAQPATVDLGGLTLSIAHRGDQSLPDALVLLPGPTDSWRSYLGILERLPSSIRTIAVSLRGHGDSDKPSHGYRIEDFASDAWDLLEALEVQRAILVGHSGSSLVARRVAIDHPDRIAGLVLEASPTTLGTHPRLEQLLTDVIGSLHDPIDAAFARSFLLDTSTEALPAETVDELVAEVQKVPARVWREMFAELQRYDDLEALEQLGVPTLLLWGDGDPLVGHDMQQELLDRLPNARLLSYAGAGHTPRWEDPDRFAGDLANFVEEVSDQERSPGPDPHG